MTLIMTLINQAGIWQCSDHRITYPKIGQVKDDYAQKQAHLKCSDGAATIAYTGIATIDGLYISDWIARVVSGESHSIEDSLKLMTHELAQHVSDCRPLILNIGAFVQGNRYFYAISNCERVPPTGSIFDIRPIRKFRLVRRLVEGSLWAISGANEAVGLPDTKLLNGIAAKHPRNPKSYEKHLANINRRAHQNSQYGRLISPTCTTTYLSPERTFSSHTCWGKPSPMVRNTITPFVLYGFDTSEMMRELVNQLKKNREKSNSVGRNHRQAIDVRTMQH